MSGFIYYTITNHTRYSSVLFDQKSFKVGDYENRGFDQRLEFFTFKFPLVNCKFLKSLGNQNTILAKSY